MKTPSSGAARHRRCLDAIAGRPADRAPSYLPAISCSVSSQILGRPAHTGTASLHYTEVLAWWNGEAAHAEFEAKLVEDLVAIHRALEPGLVRLKLMLQADGGIWCAEALAASGLPRVMLGGGDMADNRGPVYSVKCFREIVLPAYRHLLARCAELGIHYAFRSDGNL